jgi:hypothetical protein
MATCTTQEFIDYLNDNPDSDIAQYFRPFTVELTGDDGDVYTDALLENCKVIMAYADIYLIPGSLFTKAFASDTITFTNPQPNGSIITLLCAR